MCKFNPFYAFVLMSFVWASAYAQQEPLRCGNSEYIKRVLEKNGLTHQDYEAHFQRLIAKRRQEQPINGWVADEEEVLTLPVVFHVLIDEFNKDKRDEWEEYVPDQQFKDQVDTLNVHFRHQNKNKSEILPSFRALGADTKIEFGLAKRDPDGLPTDGILRGGEEIGFIPAEYASPRAPNLWEILPSLPTWSPIWDPERYLNIYVLPQANTGGFGGAGIFPVGSLDGLATSVHVEEGRGIGAVNDEPPIVVLNTTGVSGELNEAVGAIEKGYLLVHEIGHFLSLWHTFGDSDKCNFLDDDLTIPNPRTDDYCDDTPYHRIPQGKGGEYALIACNKITEDNPLSTTCGSLDMVQNYMNYSNSSCYRQFSPCQKERMRTVLNESYQRKGLTNSSLALTAPVASGTDNLKVLKTQAPANICASTYDLSVIVANLGTNTLATYEVGAYLGTTELGKKKVSGEALATWGLDTLVVAGIARGDNPASSENVEIRVTEVGGSSTSTGSRILKTLHFPKEIATAALPLKETFEATSGKTDHWTLSTETDAVVRQEVRIEGGNKALVFPYNEITQDDSFKGLGYGYPLYSPVFNVPAHKEGHLLALRVPYSFTPDDFKNIGGLLIDVITKACTATPSSKRVHKGWGGDLTSTWFNKGTNKPDVADFATLTIPLEKYIGNEPFQLQITALPSGSHPLYLDDIEVLHIPERPTGSLFMRHKPIHCLDGHLRYGVTAQHEIGNFNNSTVACAKKLYSRRETPPYVVKHDWVINAHYSSGVGEGNCLDPYTKRVAFFWGGGDAYQLGITRWTLWYDAREPSEGNEVHIATIGVNNKTPFPVPRLNDFSYEGRDWVTMPESPSYDADAASRWARNAVEKYVKGRFFESNEHKNYLLSTPLVDYSKNTTTKVYFDVSYAPHTDVSPGERVRVVVLQSCDVYNGTVVYNKAGDDLKTADATASAWTPTEKGHWRTESIDISEHARKGPIQVIFVVSNNGGNNLYLDNVALGGATRPTTPTKPTPPGAGGVLVVQENEVLQVHPNPTKERLVVVLPSHVGPEVLLTLLDANGRLIRKRKANTGASSTLAIGLPNTAQAIYFLRIEAPHYTATRRIIVE